MPSKSNKNITICSDLRRIYCHQNILKNIDKPNKYTINIKTSLVPLQTVSDFYESIINMRHRFLEKSIYIAIL
ncbi:hypothetical protein HZS_7495 [Henneguya salminicola]|nr:hypothetical protein HZS_7495 [Henneguya salminicola]